jgi:tetratricopeptide (TPR) repeat protein
VTLAVIARLRGTPDAAWRQVRRELPAGAATEPGTQILLHGLAYLQLAGLLSLDAGDLDGARQWTEAYDRWLAWSEAVQGRSEGQALWAHYHRQVGDLHAAHAHAERALAHAMEPRQPLALLAAHRLLGELDTDAGQFDDASTHLDASLALAIACEAPFERALTLLTMAELRAATGERAAAQALVDEVTAIGETLGAKPMLARANTLGARLAHA